MSVVAYVLAGAAPGEVGAQQSGVATAAALVFDGATVVDVEHGQLIPGQRVVVVGNRIQAVGRKGAVKVPQGAQVVDARHRYLIPGLWDLHTHPAHSAPVLYPLFLATGVTGIRDAGTNVPLDTMLLWRREILAGTRVGPPRQLLSDRAIDGPCSGEPSFPYHICAADSASARRIVDSLKTAGADMIKMYSLSSELYFVIAAEARGQGLLFGGHLVGSAIGASDSGVSIVDHSNTAGDVEPRCFLHETASVAQCRPIAERFRRNNTWWAPTLIAHFGRGARSAPAVRHLAELGRAFWPNSGVFTHSPRFVASLKSMFPSSNTELLAIAHRVGLPIVAATDMSMIPGFSLHTEIEIFVAQGLSPLEALQSATLNPAKMLRATDSLGTVAPGKLADLVLLDANPLANIANTTKIRAVVANGRYFDRDALDRLLAEARIDAAPRP